MKNLFVLFLLNFFRLYYTQQCGDTDFAITSGNNIVLTGSSNGVGILKPFIVNADPSSPPTMAASDNVVVHGGLRFVTGDERPRCQARTQGTLFFDRRHDEKDELMLCTRIEGPSIRYRWQRVNLGGAEGVNGPEIVDEFGSTWDGYSRVAQTWDEAQTICANLGARLPTLTELLRNVQTSGSGPISNYPAASVPIWTKTRVTTSTQYYTFTLSSGVFTATAPATKTRFRCMWAAEPAPFTGTNCHGTPRDNCQNATRFFNVDFLSRSSVAFLTAVNECHLHGGSLPTVSDVMDMAVSGVSYASGQIQVSEVSGSSRQVVSVSSFGPMWPYTSTLTPVGTASRFVCIGKKPEVPAFHPTTGCNGDCQVFTKGVRAPLVADTVSRDAATWREAFDTCQSVGGMLPDYAAVVNLMTQGWNVSDTPHWTSKLDANVGNMTTFAGSVTAWDVTASTIGHLPSSDTAPFRCVWMSTVLDAPINCGNYESPTWTPEYTIECLPSRRDSPVNHPVTPFVDSYNYTWDAESRTADTFNNANDLCMSLGGRLPTAGEVFRVSTLQNPTGTDVVLPGNEPNIPLWTLFAQDASTRVTMTQGGDAGTSGAVPQKFRCVWTPVPFGDAFGGHKCFGAPNDPDRCFRTGRFVFDRFDRPIVTLQVASQECAFLGGRLPTFEELFQIIVAGAPNGYNGFTFDDPNAPPAYGLWLAEGGLGDGKGLAMRWNVTGQATFNAVYGTSWADPSVTVSANGQQNSYRCLFSDKL